MALVNPNQAAQLGAGRFGDVDAPASDRVWAAFNPNYLAVRNDRIEQVAPEVGAVALETVIVASETSIV